MTEYNKKTCNYHKCDRPLFDEDFCIFHSLKIEDKKDKFNEAFWKEFNRQKEEEEEQVYNFMGFVFPDNISFEDRKFEKDVIFQGAQFSGGADFNGAQFSSEAKFFRAQFSGKAKFFRVQFSGEVNFSGAQFSGETYFGRSQFSDKAIFLGAQFPGKASFYKAQFSGEASFGSVQFSDKADFNVAQFPGRADFFLTQFSVEASFYKAQFFGGAFFLKTQFPGKAYFGGVQFFGEANFSDSQFSGETNFSGAQFFGEAQFDRTEFSKLVDFGGIKIERFNSFEMGGIKIERFNSFEMGDTYLYDVSGLFEYIEENKKNFKFSNKTEFLPDGFKLILGEKATAKYPIFSRKIKDDMYLLSFKDKFPKLHFLWWLLADCGRSILRWALWSIFFAVMFAAIFFSMGSEAFLINGKLPYSFSTMLYYSVVTFTTLGFGDITPNTIEASRWVMAEVIMGYVMLGGLISILANKLARRS